MTLPRRDPTIPDDQNTKIQRQSMLFLPFISIFYGGFLPAGLFIYWIVSTLFSIVQQYLIIGWGGMFPLFNWDPLFAREHKPRFPVAIPTADPTKRAPNSVLATDERAAKAATTISTPRTQRPAGPTRETTLNMSAYQEFTGKSVEEALKAAREAFGVGLNDLDFEILTPGSRGVLGMGAEPARIVAAPRDALGGSAPKREAAAATPLPAPSRDDRPQGDRPPRNDRPRDDRPHGDRPQGDRPPRHRPTPR